jgi:hypothetical protein
METARIQTVLRLRPEVMARVKRKARKMNCSFNSYVEQLLDRDTLMEFPRIPKDLPISEEVRALHCLRLEEPSPEQLARDPKLAYLWEKYGRD